MQHKFEIKQEQLNKKKILSTKLISPSFNLSKSKHNIKDKLITNLSNNYANPVIKQSLQLNKSTINSTFLSIRKFKANTKMETNLIPNQIKRKRQSLNNPTFMSIIITF